MTFYGKLVSLAFAELALIHYWSKQFPATVTEPTTVRRVIPQIDILSIGSNTRPSYLKAQEESFAIPNEGYVGTFYSFTEDNDVDEECVSNSFTSAGVKAAKEWCFDRYVHNSETTSTMMQQVESPPYGGIFMNSGPKWVCAQKRFIVGLVTVVQKYKDIPDSELPDYLLMVDDDSWYDLEQFVDSVLLKLNEASIKPLVAVACRQNKLYYHGGQGIVYSKGSLKRLTQPIPAIPTDMTSGSGDAWIDHVHKALIENQAYEMELFQPGMSIIDLIDVYNRASPFDNDLKNKWKVGFCFHSDSFITYFMEQYWINHNPKLETYTESGNKRACKKHKCTESSMICHKDIEPHQMIKRSAQLRNSSSFKV